MSKTASLQKYSTPVPMIRNPYDGLADAISDATGVDFRIPDGLTADEVAEHPNYSQTDQSQAAQADINTIVKQYIHTGEAPNSEWMLREGTNLLGLQADYHTLQNQLIAADEAFMALPAQLRARFQNDPAQLIGFLEDVSNRDEAVELGLISPKESPGPLSTKRAVGTGDGQSGTSPDDDGESKPSRAKKRGATLHDGGPGD